jgi:hypothetical protein
MEVFRFLESRAAVIKEEDGKFVLYSHDGSKKLGSYDTKEEAEKREKQIQMFKHAARSRGMREGEITTKKYQGRDHLVVPVVALMEGVIHASNAEMPELVLAEEIEKNLSQWNGRPVMLNHPRINEELVSANSPEVMEQFQIGTVFNARMKDKKLLVDAYIDQEKMVNMGEEAQKLLASIKEGKTTEVSVGTQVVAEPKRGRLGNKNFGFVWRDISSDHLAFLPEGVTGACSIAMGCGSARELVAFIEPHANAGPLQTVLRSAEMSYDEIRTALYSKISAMSPPASFTAQAGGYIEAVFDDHFVWTAPDGKMYSQMYAIGEDGTVELDGQPEAVIRKITFEAASAYAGDETEFDDFVVELLAEHTVRGAAFNKKQYLRDWYLRKRGPGRSSDSRAASCGCSSASSHHASAEARSMDKKARVAAIIASGKTCFKTADAAVLEQLSDEAIKHIEEQVEKVNEPDPEPELDPKVKAILEAHDAEAKKTPEQKQQEFLMANPDIAKIVSEHKAAAAAKKTEFVTKLKAAQTVYKEDDLNAMDVPQLEKLAALAIKPARDFGPQAPRAAEGNTEEIPTPPDMKARVLEHRKKSA